jgi:hypothetical protein
MRDVTAPVSERRDPIYRLAVPGQDVGGWT